MMGFNVFTPIGTTKHLSASGSTSNVALPIGGDRTVRVHNRLAELVFLEFGNSAIEAVVATSLPVPAGAVEFFQLGTSVTHVAGITASGSGTVDFTEGQGS